jgi:lipoate-protein ligase A
MTWKILETGSASAVDNMRVDGELLASLPCPGAPILHFYDWDGPSLTYGHFVDPYVHLDREAMEECGMQIARRPTGGGIIFHLGDFAFSVLIPADHPWFSCNTLDNYARINTVVLGVIQHFLDPTKELTLLPACSAVPCWKNFCMAQPTRYDLVIEGRKVGGAAQRRTKSGLLHQASICLAMPDLGLLKKVLRRGPDLVEAMRCNSFPLLGECCSLQRLSETKKALQHLMIKSFTSHEGDLCPIKKSRA